MRSTSSGANRPPASVARACQPAKLALLTEYRRDRTGLLVYLGTLMHEATNQLAQLHPGHPPARMTERFLSWARVRR
ncbi:hypothetical protein B5D80_31545 [Micromonospora wenchangensis]|uniref:Uncharacterized protein n=1 Tax=Micromonospora wenchangensis TaxID=1185415 RepID=A0A246R9C8_9ACTN|nr:hypothetical protein B5D80_31545 [Micromonospora wenchangensis]